LNKNTGFTATAIGSLPHTDQAEAVNLVFGTLPDIPVLPQLAKVNQNEDMTSQLNERIPGVVFDETDKRWYIDQESETFFEELEEFMLDYETIVSEGDMETLEKYAISEKRCSAMPLFLEKIRQHKPPFVKGQVIGPFTFGTTLVDREKKCAFYDETLREVLVKALTLKALWLVKKFREASPESQPIIFMDEPTISQYGTSAFITVKREDLTGCFSEISEVLKQHGVITGIHCCGKSDWSVITASKVDILNFDACCFAQSLGLYPAELENFLVNGGKIAWGIVPTMDTDALEATNLELSVQKYDEAISYLINKGLDKNLILGSTMITPACGMGILTVEQAKKAMLLTGELAKVLKEKYCVHK